MSLLFIIPVMHMLLTGFMFTHYYYFKGEPVPHWEMTIVWLMFIYVYYQLIMPLVHMYFEV